jgi:hypothetical protein
MLALNYLALAASVCFVSSCGSFKKTSFPLLDFNLKRKEVAVTSVSGLTSFTSQPTHYLNKLEVT